MSKRRSGEHDDSAVQKLHTATSRKGITSAADDEAENLVFEDPFVDVNESSEDEASEHVVDGSEAPDLVDDGENAAAAASEPQAQVISMFSQSKQFSLIVLIIFCNETEGMAAMDRFPPRRTRAPIQQFSLRHVPCSSCRMAMP